jgi:hypothetical protein
MPTVNQLVRARVAHLTNREPSSLHATERLELELRLTADDLVPLVRDVEELRGVHIPLDQVGSAQTLGELITSLSLSVAEHRRLRVA